MARKIDTTTTTPDPGLVAAIAALRAAPGAEKSEAESRVRDAMRAAAAAHRAAVLASKRDEDAN